jgi:hypothetical protein
MFSSFAAGELAMRLPVANSKKRKARWGNLEAKGNLKGFA